MRREKDPRTTGSWNGEQFQFVLHTR